LAEAAAKEPFNYQPATKRALTPRKRPLAECADHRGLWITDKQARTTAFPMQRPHQGKPDMKSNWPMSNLGISLKKLEASVLARDVVSNASVLTGVIRQPVARCVCETGLPSRTHGLLCSPW